MNLIKVIFGVAIFFFFGKYAAWSQLGNWTDKLDIGSMVQPVPQNNKFIDPGYYVWCGSVTKGDDGKFYMLYSRWPLEDGFGSWPVTSEIAVAVSDNPGGPFKHVKVALPARGTKFWDGSATHNPAIVKHDGKYYLYYMGTSSSAPIKKGEGYNDNWWHYRNTQRIGVAVADRPDGDWKRFNTPVLSVSPDSTAFDALMVSNPAAAFDDQGRVILLYKQVCKSEKISGGRVRFGVAFAGSPFGPFKKHEKPIFEINDGSTDWMVAEDPYVWFQDGTWLAIVRDVVGKFTGDSGAWALMVSKNGTDWQPARHPKVIGSTFYWEGGVAGASKLERPCLYLENGVPKYLYGATRANKEQTLSFNVAVPLLPQPATAEGLDFKRLIPENPEKHIFSMKDHFVWCNGAIKGDDGKYHLFFSRWPKSRGFDAWVTHSEIAHAVADQLLGPYRFSDVSLPARGSDFWDGENTHNPHVIRHKNKYYLYYTGTTGSGYWKTTADTVKPRGNHPEWWVNRNNQRVGVAVSDSPYGPWKRIDHPLIGIDPLRRMTATPTVFERPDGKFSLVYKTVMEKEGFRGGAVKHIIALADNPEGPFTDYNKPFITSPKSDFPIDDHVEWFQDGKYYCIAKDHGDLITEHGIALLLFESENGLDWTLSTNSLVHKFSITFKDGEHMDFERFEMPKVYLENGKVVALFLAAKPKGKEDSFSVILPVIQSVFTDHKALLGAEDMAFLGQMTRDVMESSRIYPGQTVSPNFGPNNSGGVLIRPGGRDCYPSFWIRDYAMSLESGLVTAAEQKHMISLTAATQCSQTQITKGGSMIPPGAVADHIRIDDLQPIYFPGTYSFENQGTPHWGVFPPYCDQYYFIHMVWNYIMETSDVEFLESEIEGMKLTDRLELAYKVPPVTTGSPLVYTTDNLRGVDFGFRDAIVITGHLCFSSILKFKASEELAFLFGKLNDTRKSEMYRYNAKALKTAITDSFMDHRGMLRASTGKSSQPDVWSTAFAVYLGIIDGDMLEKTCRFLERSYLEGTLAYQGNIRHILTSDDYSDSLVWEVTDVKKNTYQNGAYWGTPTGWVCNAIAKVNLQAAKKLAAEYVEELRINDYRKGESFGAPYECFHPSGYVQNPVYLTSVTCPYAFFKKNGR